MAVKSRHQCLIYEGSPARQLAAVAEVVRAKLAQNWRCLYLNSPAMVAGMRSYLAAAGVDVALEAAKSSLMLSSERHHLDGGTRFDSRTMLSSLADALRQALRDGYDGLWATGDMTWELGPEKDFSQLLEYEWQLEEFFSTHPELEGICQYHADTMPESALRDGVRAHRAVFINQTLSVVNPHFLPPRPAADKAREDPRIAGFLHDLRKRPQSPG